MLLKQIDQQLSRSNLARRQFQQMQIAFVLDLVGNDRQRFLDLLASPRFLTDRLQGDGL